MALQINFPDRTNGNCRNAYVVANLTLSNLHKCGILELFVWKSEMYRRSKRYINKTSIEILNSSEVIKKDGTVESLSYDDFAWKTGLQTYTKLKTLKVSADGSIIDLSKSTDIL